STDTEYYLSIPCPLFPLLLCSASFPPLLFAPSACFSVSTFPSPVPERLSLHLPSQKILTQTIRQSPVHTTSVHS
ncbi:hypothetical protein LX32DRAFT_673576, partial [Colletotrichum zoysiae]